MAIRPARRMDMFIRQEVAVKALEGELTTQGCWIAMSKDIDGDGRYGWGGQTAAYTISFSLENESTPALIKRIYGMSRYHVIGTKVCAVSGSFV